MTLHGSPWAVLRTTIAIAGLGFAGGSIASACLDHAGEDFGCEVSEASSSSSSSSGAGSGVGSAALGAGSGTGSASAAAEPADCGAPVTAPTVVGSGIGSAAP